MSKWPNGGHFGNILQRILYVTTCNWKVFCEHDIIFVVMYCILKADVHGCEIGFFKMSIWANGGHFDAIYRCFSICFYKWPSLAGRWLEIFICDVVRNKGLMHVKYFFLYVLSILLTLFKSSPNEMSNRGRHVPLVTETRTVFHAN